jgi:predicted RNA-binding Zn-ribbon protein involved in translation (DUF1610 family)
MPDAIDSPNYDAALAAATLILELFGTSPGQPEPIALSQCTYIVLQAIEITHQSVTAGSGMLCVGCSRRLTMPAGSQALRVQCPHCGRKQVSPILIEAN